MSLINFMYIVILSMFLQLNSILQNVVSALERSEILRDPIIYYSTMEIACSDGYPVQEHKVETADGYVLTIHRIPRGRIRRPIPRSIYHFHKIHLDYHPDFDGCVRESMNITNAGTPIVMFHGILVASDGWLLQGPGYDLVYLLADQGYDVWLGNVRGNFYSRKHRTLSPSDPRFWDFSFHENALYDYPAIVDYVLKSTKKEKVGVIGYSMGTSTFLAMASVIPKYNDKVLGFAAMAPVVFVNQTYLSPMRRSIINLIINVMQNVERRGNVFELFPRTNRFLTIGKNYCSKGSRLQDVCYDLVTILLGYHSKLVLRDKLHLYLTHVPTGTSLKTFSHYIQIHLRDWFRPYDYGTAKNVHIYGTPLPPPYPIWNVTVPIGLYYTDGDLFYDVRDIEYLQQLLPNVVDVSVLTKFNHGDYLWSYKARDLVYRRILSFFQKLRDQYDVRSYKKLFFN